jgi:hypothetical protein
MYVCKAFWAWLYAELRCQWWEHSRVMGCRDVILVSLSPSNIGPIMTQVLGPHLNMTFQMKNAFLLLSMEFHVCRRYTTFDIHCMIMSQQTWNIFLRSGTFLQHWHRDCHKWILCCRRARSLHVDMWFDESTASDHLYLLTC